MPTPDPRTPICIARGDFAVLEASKADLQEGEICWASDQQSLYVKQGADLVKASGLPDGEEYDLLQVVKGEWAALNEVNGGNF